MKRRFWVIVARALGLSMLTVNPAWREVRYKIIGKHRTFSRTWHLLSALLP